MAKTIFMIHGMFGGPWYWENYIRVFEREGYHCVATTLPYHNIGAGEVPDARLGTVSLLEYADALEKEISKLDSKPILMGHSMGGLLAQMLASRGVAEAVVLLTPASPAGIVAVRPSVIKSFWSVLTTWGCWRKPMRLTFDEASYSMLYLLPLGEQKEIYDRFIYESGRVMFEIAFWLFDSTHASSVDEDKVTCPVLVIAGSKDRITPASVVRRVASKYKAVSTYKEFDDHCHWVVSEPGWQDVANYVMRWLEPLGEKNTSIPR